MTNAAKLATADQACQSEADAEILGGSWIAWISLDTGNVDAHPRLTGLLGAVTAATVPYTRVDGVTTVSANADALVSSQEKMLLDLGIASRDDVVVMLAGTTPHAGATNIVKLHRVGESEAGLSTRW